MQHSSTAHLSASLPGQLPHGPSAWVRGCVHMFAWVVFLRRRHRTAHPGEAAQGGTSEQGGAGSDAGPLSIASLQHCLARAAGLAGAEGAVDVQVGVDQLSGMRYNLDGSAQDSTQHGAQSSPDGRVVLVSLDPPCLVLPSAPVAGAGSSRAGPVPTTESEHARHVTSPAATVKCHLTSQLSQRVRVLVVAAATGTVLVDCEHDLVAAAEGATLPLQVPLGTSEIPAGKPRALRVVITTPAPAPHSDQAPHGDQPSPPACSVLATATFLAAPAPLASELCSLYTAMEAEGQETGLTTGEVWAQHWQPLVNDISLCLSCSGTATGMLGTQQPAMQQAVQEVAESLIRFCSAHDLQGWRQHLETRLLELSAQVETGAEEQPPVTSGVPALDPHLHLPAAATAPASPVACSPSAPQPAADAGRSTSAPTPPPGEPAKPQAKKADQGSTSGSSVDSGNQCSASSSTTATTTLVSDLPVPPLPAPPLRSMSKPAGGSTSRSTSPASVPPGSPGALQTLASAYGWAWPLTLLVSGFPDAGDEAAWWHEWRSAPAGRYSIDPLTLVAQSIFWIAFALKDVGSLRYSLLLQVATTSAWLVATVRCILRPSSRRRRAQLFLWAAVTDAVVVALMSTGLLGIPCRSASPLVHSRIRFFCNTMARCMQSQGVLVRWIPIGAALCINAAILHLSVGRPLTQVLFTTGSTWLVAGCLAAVLEVHHRLAFLRQRRLSAPTAVVHQTPSAPSKAAAGGMRTGLGSKS